MDFHSISSLRVRPPARYSWVEVFSLSTVIHGFLIGCVAIGWILMDGKGSSPYPRPGSQGGNPTVCFWDESESKPAAKFREEIREKGQETADLSPFTIQLSPVGILATPGGTPGLTGSSNQELGSGTSSSKGGDSWFDPGLLPENVAWVIDSSLSMGINAHFETAGTQLTQALGKTTPSTKNRVWFYSHTIREIAPAGGWAPMTPDRMEVLKTELTTVKPSGSTDLGAALKTVLATGPGVIHVVTDEDLLTQKDLNTLFRLQARQAKAMPRIRVVVMTRPRQETPLQAWCRQAGCSYKVVAKGSGETFTGSGSNQPRPLQSPASRSLPPEQSFPAHQSRLGGR